MLDLQSVVLFCRGVLIGKMVVPLGCYPGCLTPPRSPLKGDPIDAQYIRCIWGWLLKVASKGTTTFPMMSYTELSLAVGFVFTGAEKFSCVKPLRIWKKVYHGIRAASRIELT